MAPGGRMPAFRYAPGLGASTGLRPVPYRARGLGGPGRSTQRSEARAHKSKMMRTYKRTRARRNLKRPRRVTRRKSRALATKAYVQKAVARKQDSKMCQFSDAFYANSENPTYRMYTMYKWSTPGVTDRGRIGNTIWATKIVVRFVINVQHFSDPPTSSEATQNYDKLTPESVPPFWVKMFLVQRKSGTGDLKDSWFNEKDRGVDFPVMGLTPEHIQDGCNTINVADKTILKYKTVSVRVTRDNRQNLLTGSFTYRFPKAKKITLNDNEFDNAVDDRLINPNIQFVIYPYWGYNAQHGSAWGIRYSMYQYYKD